MHPKWDKQLLLDSIKAEYAFANRILALIGDADVAQSGVCGHWSIKDVIAHLTSWEERTLRWLDDTYKGIPLTIPETGFGWHQFDEINDVYYQKHRADSFEQIRDNAVRVQALMLDTVARLTDEELAGNGRMTGMFSDSPADAIAANTFEHYQLHLEQIRVWLNQR